MHGFQRYSLCGVDMRVESYHPHCWSHSFANVGRGAYLEVPEGFSLGNILFKKPVTRTVCMIYRVAC